MVDALINVPGPLLLQNIEGLRDDSDFYQTIKGLLDGFNQLTAFVAQQANQGTAPQGPQAVADSQLDGTVKVTWANEESGCSVVSYSVWRASAGTRSAPTNPSFASAVRVDVIPAQVISCLPTGSAYTWYDKNFTVLEKDPANPARKQYWVTSIDNEDNESIPIPAGIVELFLNGPGDNSPEPKGSPINLLWNTSFYNANAAFFSGLALNNAYTISVIANTTPIQVTFQVPHAFITGDKAAFWGTSRAALNGYRTVTVLSTTKVSVDGTVSPGPSLAKGYGIRYNGQPAPPTNLAPDGSVLYTPWLSGADGTVAVAGFIATAGVATAEIELPPAAPGTSISIAQGLDGTRLRYGQHLTFSVYARRVGSVPTNSRLLFSLGGIPGMSTTEYNFDASLLTTTYQRFTYTFPLPTTGTWGIFDGTDAHIIVIIGNVNLSGTGCDMYVARPMLNEGDQVEAWTNVADDSIVTSGQTSNYNAAVFIPRWTRQTAQIIARNPAIVYQ